MDRLPSIDALDAAARIVGAAMPPTPQYAWPLLARRQFITLQADVHDLTPVSPGRGRDQGGQDD